MIEITAHESGDSPLSLRVINGGPTNFNCNVTLVMGGQDAVLIDMPFTRSQGHRVVAEILETQLNLKYIYVTHSHPDHHFSSSVFAQAFPNTDIIALPQIALNVGMAIPGRIRFWGPMLGTNSPGNPVIPKAYYDSFIELEGEKLEILGPMHGDHHESTAVYIPSLEAVIAGDIVFSGIHLFMAHATPEDRKKWLITIQELISLNPKIVVAGHKLPGMDDGPQSLEYCHDYLVAFEEAVSQTSSSTELIAAVQNRFPDIQDVMDNFILTRSAKVASGELEPSLETAGLFD